MATTRPGRAWALRVGLCVAAVGCRAKPVPGDAEPPAPPEPPPATTSRETPPPGCDELGAVELSLEPELLSLACKDDFRDCSGHTTLTVSSCAAAPIELHELLLRPVPPLQPPVVSVGDVRIEPGGTWTMALEFRDHGVYEVSLAPLVRRPGDPELRVGTARLTVENPARERAFEACRECNGDWSRHGMLSVEGCVCRTHDAGTRCDDADDCEAMCIEWERGSGFRCSEFTTEWGCHSYLPHGWSKVRHPEGTVPPYVCVD